jgi:hypothetical protein
MMGPGHYFHALVVVVIDHHGLVLFGERHQDHEGGV